MTRYIVLWIPTMSKRNLQVYVHELPESHLQDIPNTNGVRILASIDDNFNISFSYKDDTEAAFHNLTLQCICRQSNGFIEYSYEVAEDADDYLSVSLRLDFHQAYYHYLKGFFHKHNQHDSEEDSLLKPVFSETELSFENRDHRNKILRSYFSDYKDKILGTTKEVNLHTESVVAEIAQGQNISRNLEFFHACIIRNYRIKGEIEYCRFLLSQYKNDGLGNERKELETAIEHFMEADSQMQFWYNHYMSLNSFTDGKKGVRIGWAGFIVGVFSIVLTSVLECSHTFSLTNEDQTQHLDSISNLHFQKEETHYNRIDSTVTSLRQQLDSLQSELKQLKAEKNARAKRTKH